MHFRCFEPILGKDSRIPFGKVHSRHRGSIPGELSEPMNWLAAVEYLNKKDSYEITEADQRMLAAAKASCSASSCSTGRALCAGALPRFPKGAIACSRREPSGADVGRHACCRLGIIAWFGVQFRTPAEGSDGRCPGGMLKALAQTLGCLVLGVDTSARTWRPAAAAPPARRAPAISCWPASAINRSAEHKVDRAEEPGPPAGPGIPFHLRVVGAPEPDDDGEPVTSMVVDKQPNTRAENQVRRDRIHGPKAGERCCG